MSLVAIETLAMRVAGARQALELLDPALGIVAASQFLQVIANQLVEAFSESLRPLPGTRDGLLVNRQGNIH